MCKRYSQDADLQLHLAKARYMCYVVPLICDELHVPTIGRKAQNLRSLVLSGISILDGLVITTSAFMKFADVHNLICSINKLSFRDTSTDIAESIICDIRNKIRHSPFPDEIITAIRSALRKITASNIIVRSSALMEDSEDASFAGIHETVLNVPCQFEHCIAAVRQCWESIFSEKAIAYRRIKNCIDAWEMAVLIQEMMCTSIAGSIWTHYNDDGLLLIEAVPGLGVSLASGSTTTDSFLIHPSSLSIIETHISNKSRKIKCNPLGGTVEKKINISSSLLSLKMLKEIAKTAISITRVQGSPQLIEWGISDNKIIIFQSRPMTIAPLSSSRSPFLHDFDYSGLKKLSGIVVNPGSAHGITRLLNDPDNASPFDSNEIAISKHIIPEMVIALNGAAAIISEDGGLTSHASIIARELNIPAIVSVENACEVLSSGTEIFIDGNSGVVILSEIENGEIKPVENKTNKTDAKTLLNNYIKVNKKNECMLLPPLSILSDIQRLIQEGYINLSKTGNLIFSTPNFHYQWSEILSRNTPSSLIGDWQKKLGEFLVSIKTCLEKISPQMKAKELSQSFISFYIFNIISESYPIELCLHSIIDGYVKQPLNQNLLSEAIDVSYSENISFSKLLMQLLLPLPDTYTSLIRVANDRESMISILQSSFDEIAYSYENDSNDYMTIIGNLSNGTFPKRISHKTSISKHAIAIYKRIMQDREFSQLSFCLDFIHALSLINDVNRYLPVAYADNLDLMIKKLFPKYVRTEAWPWNCLLEVMYPTIRA